MPERIPEKDDGLVRSFKIVVKTNAKEVGVFGKEVDLFGEEALLVKTKEPPQDGKANEDVIKILSKHFGVPQRNVRIKSGLTSRYKVVSVKNSSA